MATLRNEHARVCAYCALHSVKPNPVNMIFIISQVFVFGFFLCANVWSGRRDSDPRLSPWQGDTLPLSHSRKQRLLYQINCQNATIFRYKNQKIIDFFQKVVCLESLCEKFVLYILANCAIIVKIWADVVELADTQDLGSCAGACRFKSCHPHQTRIKRTFGVRFFPLYCGDGLATLQIALSANFVCNLHLYS